MQLTTCNSFFNIWTFSFILFTFCTFEQLIFFPSWVFVFMALKALQGGDPPSRLVWDSPDCASCPRAASGVVYVPPSFTLKSILILSVLSSGDGTWMKCLKDHRGRRATGNAARFQRARGNHTMGAAFADWMYNEKKRTPSKNSFQKGTNDTLFQKPNIIFQLQGHNNNCTHWAIVS